MHSPVKTAVGGARDLLTSPAGVVAFRRTGRTPHGTYRVMRKTLSVAPRLAPRAYRLVLPTPTARPETDPTGLLDRLGAGDAHTTAEALRSDGFVRFDGLVDPSTCDALEALARTVDCELMPSPAEGPGVGVVDPGAPRAPKYSVPEAALAADPAAQALIADASLRAVAADYLGCEPVWSLTAMWWSFPWPGGPSTEIAQLFHEDRDHPAFLKFFLYLTDVDEQHGPHVYVRGSHDEHRRTLRADRRYADDEVARHFGDDDLVTVCGPRGTLFAADTKGLHKGLPPVAGARLVFQLEFSSTLFGAPYQRLDAVAPSPALAAALAAHPHTYQRLRPGAPS